MIRQDTFRQVLFLPVTFEHVLIRRVLFRQVLFLPVTFKQVLIRQVTFKHVLFRQVSLVLRSKNWSILPFYNLPEYMIFCTGFVQQVVLSGPRKSLADYFVAGWFHDCSPCENLRKTIFPHFRCLIQACYISTMDSIRKYKVTIKVV